MFEHLLDILNDSKIPFVAYRWDQAPVTGPYGTAQIEGGADVVAGDGKILEQAVRASVDLYAPDPDSAYPKAVQDVLNGEFAWTLNSVQYEEDTRIIHYEWLVEMEGL